MEKIQSWGESRYFDFRVFEKHHPLPEREENYHIISSIASFLLLKNDQEIWKKGTKPRIATNFALANFWSHSFVGFL